MNSTDLYIWQRRIHHGVRRQKSGVPFPESVEIGLEFNAALEREEKLDSCLLTNAVMLELCDFAKTVTKSETYFLFEMLQFNFDLGLDMDNDPQCYEYAKRVHCKIKLAKDQIKTRPSRWKETFPLPDPDFIMRFTGPESGRYFPKWNKMVDSSVLTDSSKNSQSSENQMTTNSTDIIKKKRGNGKRLPGDAYPFCNALGVTLTVRPEDAPKQKLDPSLLTYGVMLELLHFSKVLCGTQTGIVHDLVKHNFGLDLDKSVFRMQVSKLMERKCMYLTAEDRDAFRREAFKVQTKQRERNPKKRKNPVVDYQELEGLTMSSKRRETLRRRDNNEKEIWQDSDLSYMCPVDFETEMQLGVEVEPNKMKTESYLSGQAVETMSTMSTMSLDVKEEEEEVFVSPVLSHDPTCLNCRPKNTTLDAVSDLFFEDKNKDANVKTPKQKLWMRRATRAKQILKSSRVNDMFAHCRQIALDFNVGSGNKQSVDLQLLTNRVLLEIYKFATAMTKSLSSFLLEILDNNFKLTLQDKLHQRNFIFYMTTKDRVLQHHPARQKREFLSSRFQFPEAYTMVDGTDNLKTEQDIKTEQQTEWDSAWKTSLLADIEIHPFCNELGLNLWSTEQRPVSQKLDFTVLTTGAVLEIFSFVRELCGSVRESVNDILEHNFDLDLQDDATEAAKVIHRWYATQKSLMKKQTPSTKVNRWLSGVVPLNGYSQLASQSPTGNHQQDLDPDFKPERKMGPFNGNVQQMKGVNNYHMCRKIGLDLDVGTKPEAKAKLDLRVLTRGVLFEMHQYVRQNCKRYIPALYEILEYNFDLSSQSHRKVEFAWSIASQVMAIAGKHGRKGDYLNKLFELPFEVSESTQVVCKEEPEDVFGGPELNDTSDIMFVRELKPVDIEVEIE